MPILTIAACATFLVSEPLAAQADAASRIEIRVTPLADLWAFVRARATPPEASKGKPASVLDLPGLEDAAALARSLDRRFGSTLEWGVLDRELEFCEDVDGLVARFENLPEKHETRSGTIALREDALALARAVAVVEERFLDEVWPEHEKQIEAAKSRLAKTFFPHEKECFAEVLGHFGIPDPGVVVPVFLVHEIPPFGGVTYVRGARDASAKARGGICFLAVTNAEGTQLDETLLHECTHAIDVATPLGVGLIEELRSKLQAAGVGPRDKRNHDLWHTIYFAEAAATIQRRVDPKHRPYGEVAGYYPKVPTAAAIVLPRWEQYLAGKLDRATLLEQLVAETVKSDPGRRG